MRIPAFALLTVFAAMPAFADPIPGVTLAPVSATIILTTIAGSGTYGGGVYPGYDSTNPGLVTQYNAGYSFGGEIASLAAANAAGSDPAVSSSLEVGGIINGTLPFQHFDARSVMSYQFAINGPAGQTVPITLDGSGSVSAIRPGTLGADFGAEAILSLSPASGVTGLADSYYGIACIGHTSVLANALCITTPSPTFGSSIILNLQTNTAYNIDLSTEDFITVILGTPIPGLVELRSSVDPTITLDTSDPAYSLEFSPGLLGSSPTPEPTAAVLLGTGIAGLAFVTWRR